MSYAAATSTPKSVKAMFLRRSQIEGAVRQARQDVYRANVENFESDLQQFAAGVKASIAAAAPGRPSEVAQRPIGQDPIPKG